MKLLIVANIYSHHIISILNLLKKQSPDFCIDFFNTNFHAYSKGEIIPQMNLYNKIFNAKERWPKLFYKIPRIRGFLAHKDLVYAFKRINCKYDSITFHQVPSFGVEICDIFHNFSTNIIVYPFGSEVLRVSKKRQGQLVKFFQNIDYCVMSMPHMVDVICKNFGFNKSIIKIGYGSRIIDLINNSNYTKETAKSAIGFDGKYVITCGYNGYRGQNQLDIVLQIAKIKNQLPNNYLIVVPMTYGASKKYVKDVEKVLSKSQLNYLILQSFMSEDDVVLHRFATDIFIHAQETDNLAASVSEFLLCGAKMLNWSKLRYSALEEYGRPYFIYDKFDSIGEKLLVAINSDSLVTDSLLCYLKSLGRDNQMKLWSEFYHSLI